MHILRNFVVAFSIAAVAAPIYLRAEDTDAQAAARAALRQKMQELNGGQPASSQPEAAPETNAVAPTPPPVATPPPAAPTPPEQPAPAPQLSTSNDLIEQARAATRARISELQKEGKFGATNESVYQAPPSTEAKPSKEEIRAEKREAAKKAAEEKAAAKKAAEEKKAQERATAKKIAEEKAAAEKAAAQEAAQKQAHEKAGSSNQTTNSETAPAEKNTVTQVKKKTKPEQNMEPAPALAPMPAPPAAVPASKEEKLKALLQQYEADKITAEEYHEQRAKILAEP